MADKSFEAIRAREKLISRSSRTHTSSTLTRHDRAIDLFLNEFSNALFTGEIDDARAALTATEPAEEGEA